MREKIGKGKSKLENQKSGKNHTKSPMGSQENRKKHDHKSQKRDNKNSKFDKKIDARIDRKITYRLLVYLKSSYRLFIDSFTRLDRSFLYSIFVNMLQMVLVFLVLVPSLLVLLNSSVVPLMSEVMPTVLYVQSYANSQGGLPDMNPELEQKLDANVSVIKMFFLRSGFLLFGFMLLLFLISTLASGFIYSWLHKFSFRRFIMGFFICNLLWYLLWMMLITIQLVLFRIHVSGYLIAATLILFILLTPLFRSVCKEKAGLKDSLKIFKMFLRQCIFKLYLFLVPLLMIYIVFMALFMMLSYSFDIIPFRAMSILVVIMIFAFIAWSRNYVFICVRHSLDEMRVNNGQFEK
ncbi:hypothetical protein JXB31_00570 [Candidatus Woesearchaeota archaeon]|nr:hypothetical protein [Candidatus Woesearchaeota archaeon]